MNEQTLTVFQYQLAQSILDESTDEEDVPLLEHAPEPIQESSRSQATVTTGRRPALKFSVKLILLWVCNNVLASIITGLCLL